MPASRSPSPRARAGRGAAVPVRATHSLWPWILIGMAGVFSVAVVVLPASVVTHFLPPNVHAEDFSGSIWHGSAGRITVNARDAGALEWRVHPAALLKLSLAADVHWVKVGFVIDGTAAIDRHGYDARDIKGGGPIEDLRDFGVAAGWRGIAGVNFSVLKGDFEKIALATGDITVSNLASAQVAEGADLGSYDLSLPDGAVAADGSVNAKLSDIGGPLETQAGVQLLPAEHRGTLSGTVRERADAPPALRRQLDGLSQLRGRDPQGRITVDLEFTF